MKKLKTARKGLSLATSACLLLGSAGALQGGQQLRPVTQDHQQEQTAKESPPAGPTKVAIPDAVVLDQNSQKVRFYSDLVKGKIVAVNFMFTTCTTIDRKSVV